MTDRNTSRIPFSAEELLGSRISRRSMLRRSAALGLSVPVVSTLLAACGDDDIDDDVEVPDVADDDDEPAVEPDDDDVEVEDDDDVEEDPEDDDDAPEVDDDHESVFGDDYEPPEHLGGQLIYGSFSDAPTLNPVLASDTTSAGVSSLFTKGMITAHPLTTEPHPQLAESWDISDDGIEYTFHLREDVTWHDGEQLTADDVVFTYDTHMHEDTGSPRTAELTERIETIEAADDYTVQINLNFPASAFLQQNAIYLLIPEHVLGDVEPGDLAGHDFSVGTEGVTIGCGPFQFQERASEDHITLVKYPDYYEGEPNLDQWIMRVVPDQTVLATQLGTGELDYGSIQEADFDSLDAQDNVDVILYDTFNFTFYTYQMDEEVTTLFQEREVRQALLYALDREALINAIRFGIGEVARGTMPVPSWAYNPDGLDRDYEYDPDRAREMLDEAGWVEGDDGVRERDGERLSFQLWTNAGNEIREQYVTVMQEQWREIGVECTPQTEEWSAFLDRILSTRDYEMALLGFSWGVEPHQETMWHTDAYEGGFNMNRYSNPEVDDLLAQGLATTDRDERTEIYTEMQNIILEDLPTVILDFPQGITGVNQRVHNVFPSDVDYDPYSINAHEWWVDE